MISSQHVLEQKQSDLRPCSAARLLQLLLLVLLLACTPAHAGPNDIVILIGNREYRGDVPKVEYAVRDAQAFAKAARDVLGVRPENIKDLSNLDVIGFRRWFGDAGEGSPELAALVRAKDARIYLFYSGHGMPAERPDGTAVRVLLPIDALPHRAGREGYPITWVRDAVRKVQGEKAPDGSVVLLFDACFSGSSAAGTLVTGSSAVSLLPSKIREAAAERVVELAASSSDQVAYWDMERQHGAFTDALLDGLYGEAADIEGRVTAERLVRFVEDRVGQRLGRLFPRETKRQTPVLQGDGLVVLASLAKDLGARPIRDEEAASQERTLCRTLPVSEDIGRIQAFLGSCRVCACREQLKGRLRVLARMTSICEAEGRELARLVALGEASRAEIETLAKTAECPQTRAAAEARNTALEACAAAASSDRVLWVDLDAAKAVPICRDALNISPNNAATLVNLGLALMKAEQYAESRTVLLRAADMGDAAGMNGLGELYEMGWGVAKDGVVARQWYEKAIAKGDVTAMTNLGDLHHHGNGVTQDYVAARQWYERAAAKGSVEAMARLGNLYYAGNGVPQDYVAARQWYEKAAAKGHAEVMNFLGVLSENGQGVPQDYVAARQWYEKAVAKGNARAMTNLGDLYYTGNGVVQDYVAARQWYVKGAARGDATAMNNLGALYAWGRGGPQDHIEARQWYEKAAAKGNAKAYANLGSLYALGQGVKKDCAIARQHFAKARKIDPQVTFPTGAVESCGRS